MASKSIYCVIKDGNVLEELKTLTAAKKLAEAENAEVHSNGRCVYKAERGADNAENAPVTEIITAEPTVSKKPTHPVVDEPMSVKYRLKKLMNVRAKPSREAKIVTTKPAGTIVRVLAVEADWLHLADGSFILYGNGAFAEKI